jgi:hypothetical protein
MNRTLATGLTYMFFYPSSCLRRFPACDLKSGWNGDTFLCHEVGTRGQGAFGVSVRVAQSRALQLTAVPIWHRSTLSPVDASVSVAQAVTQQ